MKFTHLSYALTMIILFIWNNHRRLETIIIYLYEGLQSRWSMSGLRALIKGLRRTDLHSCLLNHNAVDGTSQTMQLAHRQC